jgi:hypothetical protein
MNKKLKIKNKILLSICFLLISGYNVIGQSATDSLEKIKYYKKVIGFLASDSLKGREVSSIYERMAAEFIVKELKQLKSFKPKYHDFIYQTSDTATAKTTSNIYCYLDNKADSTVVISAHYEHIGMGAKSSLAFGKKNQIHNGADDNASGVALVLGLAKTYSKWMSKKVNYVFVFYSAHEIGLYGSKAFYNLCKLKFKPICAVLNFDMVGRLDLLYSPMFTLYGARTIPANVKPDLMALPLKVKLDFDRTASINQTDCRVFVESKIPSLSITTGTHNEYHKPDDDIEYIKWDGMCYIQTFLEQYLLKHSFYSKEVTLKK